MSKRKQKLIVVAHPDDETLFFGALVLSDPRAEWSVVCVTDGNADGQKAVREKQFRAATRKLGVKKVYFFEMPDRYEARLDQAMLTTKLTELPQGFAEVYTHGPIGEYGHPHHQDVSLAVHRFFAGGGRRGGSSRDAGGAVVWGAAHNCAPDKVVTLKPAVFEKKAQILAKTYFSETERFISFVPATFSEGFAKFSLREVEAIHQFFAGDAGGSSAGGRSVATPGAASAAVTGATPGAAPAYLKKYKWFLPYFSSLRERLRQRPF